MILNKKLYERRTYFFGSILSCYYTFILFVKNLFSRKSNFINYPKEKFYYSDRYKGVPYLTLKDDSSLRCNACMLCSTICPSNCIHIFPGQEERNSAENIVLDFKIEILRCIYCGLCEEACPIDAIRMSNEYRLPDFHDDEWLLDIEYLSQRSTLNHGKGIQSRVDDKDRLKLRL